MLVVANRCFFFVIPSDFDDDGPDRLFVFIPNGVAVVVLFGDNERGSSSFTMDERTVNDEEVGRELDIVLLIITRVGGLDATECTDEVVVFDEDRRISDMELVRS